MMMYYMFSFIVLFFSSLFIYIYKYKHLLLMLLSLESVVLSLFIFVFLYSSYFLLEYFTSMFYLTLSVCEGALGLAMLVLMIRTHGSDYMLIFDNLW